MKIAIAIVSGVLTSAFVSFMLLMVGFLFGASMSIPGLLTITSTGGDSPQADIRFYPYAPIALAIAMTCVFWIIGRIRDRSRQQ